MKSDFQDPAQDPRLTAYALGELTDPHEVEAVESLLRGSPALRREVESLRATAELIQLELEQEPCPSLAPHQLASLGEPPRSWSFWARVRPGNRSWWIPAGLATAAAVAVMVSAAILFLQETEEPTLSAGLQRPEPVMDEALADLGRVTKKAQDPASPGPGATAPRKARSNLLLSHRKQCPRHLLLARIAPGSSLPAVSEAADLPAASRSGPVQSNEQELFLSSRSEQVREAYVETVPPAAMVESVSESSHPPISYARARENRAPGLS